MASTTVVMDDRPRVHNTDTGRARTAGSTATSALLKIFEIILAIIIICLVAARPNDEYAGPDRPYAWYYPMTTGEEFTIATATLALVATLHFLLLYLSGCHRYGHAYDCKCHLMAGGLYLLIAICWFISAGVETWVTTLYAYDDTHTTRYRMRAAAAAFCYLEGLLYLGSLAMSRFRQI